MLLWDVIRNRRLHAAYWIFAAARALVAVAINLLWATPWWRQTAKAPMRAG